MPMTADRRWLELRLLTPDETARALVPDAAVRLGARGVVEEDEGHVAWVEEPDDVEAFVADVRRRLRTETGADELSVEWRWQDHEAWAHTWKRGLGPRRVTDRIVVHPSWKRPRHSRPEDLVIVLDPGMAFGTAEHGTTRGCLRLLDGAVTRGSRILDVGAGSGILSIAAVRLGASEVTAVEGDDLSCEALEENLRRNGVSRRIRLVRAWVDAPSLAALGIFDGVMANLETGRLRPLVPGLTAAVSGGGWLLVSGILDHEWDDVESELTGSGFSLEGLDEDGEWRSALLRRASGHGSPGGALGQGDGVPAARLDP